MNTTEKNIIFLFPPMGHRLDLPGDAFDLLKEKGYVSIWYQFGRAENAQECLEEAKEIKDEFNPLMVAVADTIFYDKWVSDQIMGSERGVTKLVDHLKEAGIPIYWIERGEIFIGGPFDDELTLPPPFREEFVNKLINFIKNHNSD